MSNVQTFSYSNSFRLDFTKDIYKGLNDSIIEVILPSVSIGTAYRGTAIKELAVAGNTFNIDTLSVRYLLDQDFTNYMLALSWIISLKNPKAVDSDPLDFSDIAVHILDNKSNPNQVYILEDCFPISISEIEFQTQMSDNNPITFTMNFQVNNINITSNSNPFA